MRKWQDQAAPDDPNSWFDVAGVQPTPYGTYETCSTLSASLTGVAGQPIYAFKGQGVSVVGEYLVTTTKILDASLTDRTGGVTVGTYPHMVQYGDVTICAMGSGNPTVFANAGNFAALAGAPKAEILVVQRNCVVAFNTDAAADGWAASDVGDYTNWTTGEAASGRILTTPGWVTAAVPFGNDIIVFKPSAIYRMTYVGGLIKWSIDLIWSGVGCTVATGQTQNYAKYYACAGLSQILFFGQGDSPIYTNGSKIATSYAYLFDGASPPKCVNPLTTINEGVVLHDPSRDTFTVFPIVSATDRLFFYNVRNDMWGKTGNVWSSNFLTSTHAPIPVTGVYYIRQTRSPMPNFWGDNAGNLVKYTTDNSPRDISFTPYLQTMSVYFPDRTLGPDERVTSFTRLVPRYRRKSGGTTAILTLVYPILTVNCYRERYAGAASATVTVTQSASTVRDRFDFTVSDNYARFKLSFQYYDAEIEDFSISMQPAGTD